MAADEAHFEQLNDVVKASFETQPVGGALRDVENAIVAEFEGKTAVLSKIECRTSICRLEVDHGSAAARKELDDMLGTGSLANGAMTFAKPDRSGTVVFAGVAGNPLTLASLGLE